MNKTETLDKMADMLRSSRYASGKSQEYMAKALGVSKRTVQNWEDGVSCPTIAAAYDWFNILRMPPQPYLLSILYPDMDNINFDPDKNIDSVLRKIIQDLPIHTKKKLLFILSGKHGSSPISVIDMMVANLQTPLRDRLNICQNILINYEISQSLGQLTDEESVHPSIDNLTSALKHGMTAVRERKNSYLNS